MKYISVKGIVLREYNVGESDKLLTVFTDTCGKITVSAKGAKRQGSRFLSVAQPFCYSEMQLYKGKNMYNLSGCSLIESFYNLRNDIDVLLAGGNMLKTISAISQEELPDEETLNLLLHALYYLNKGNREIDLLLSVFYIKLMCFQGYSPIIDRCVGCGEPIVFSSQSKKESYLFSVQEKSIVCEKCGKTFLANSEIIPLNEGSYAAIKHICGASLDRLFNFGVSDEVKKQLKCFDDRMMKACFNI